MNNRKFYGDILPSFLVDFPARKVDKSKTEIWELAYDRIVERIKSQNL
jgi:hypothetical protein